MRWLLALFFSLCGSVWIGLWILKDPGQLIFAYQQYTVEMPLWFGGIVMVASFLVTYLLLRFISRIKQVPGRVVEWKESYQRQLTLRRFANGLMDLSQGNWERARQNLLSCRITDKTLQSLQYLSAAQAAQGSGRLALRDDYLAKAEHVSPKNKLSVHLSRAQYELESGQLDNASLTLTKLKAHYPRHPKVLLLLKELYLKSTHWEALSQLLPRIQRYRLLPDVEVEALQVAAAEGVLAQAEELSALKRAWRKLPYKFKNHPSILARYAAGLMAYQQHQEAETLLYHALKKQLSDELLHLYGLCHTPLPAKHLSRGVRLLTNAPENPMLLLALGRISKQNRLWGQARSYFERCLQFSMLPEACQELGALLDMLGETDLSLQYFRQGLDQSLSASVTYKIDHKKAK